jgi:hypothetical protein
MFADEARFGRINRPRPCWAPIGISSPTFSSHSDVEMVLRQRPVFLLARAPAPARDDRKGKAGNRKRLDGRDVNDDEFPCHITPFAAIPR